MIFILFLSSFFPSFLLSMVNDQHTVVYLPIREESNFHELAMRAINSGNKNKFKELFNNNYMGQITREKLNQLSDYSMQIESGTKDLIAQNSDSCDTPADSLMITSLSSFLMGMPPAVFCLTSGCAQTSVIFTGSVLGIGFLTGVIGSWLKCKNISHLNNLEKIVKAQPSIRECIEEYREDYSVSDETESASSEDV